MNKENTENKKYSFPFPTRVKRYSPDEFAKFLSLKIPREIDLPATPPKPVITECVPVNGNNTFTNCIKY